MIKSLVYFFVRTIGSALMTVILFYGVTVLTLGAALLVLGMFPRFVWGVAAVALLSVGTVIVYMVPGRLSIGELTGHKKWLLPLASILLVLATFSGYRFAHKAQVHAEEIQKLQMSIERNKLKYPGEWNKSHSGSSPQEVLLTFLDAQARGDDVTASQLLISHTNEAQGPYSDSVKERARAQAEAYRAGRYVQQTIEPGVERIIIEHYPFVAVQNSTTGMWNLWSY